MSTGLDTQPPPPKQLLVSRSVCATDNCSFINDRRLPGCDWVYGLSWLLGKEK